jgi:intron-binding protein aquarius
LSTYNGQKELIKDILNKRCRFNPLFGVPKVSTVDQFQGQQADYILLSLVRSKSIGHVRDVRRLIVALSRSRLGLYVFCRTALFRDCKELAPAFNVLLSRPSGLNLLPDEKFGHCNRALSVQPVKGRFIKDVMEMGKLVVELSKSKS